MGETKRRLETFSFYDRTGIEAHLERMAELGWLLDKIGNFGWRYRRIAPQKLTFSVCYFPKASQFDPGPSEEQETFYDFCRHTGWTLAAASAQMQVFYNEGPHPVPIDTDPALEIDAIHRSAKKSWLLSMFALLAVSIMNEAMFLWRLMDDPVGSLSSTPVLFCVGCYGLLLLLIAVELGSYYSWRRRAKRAAELGEFLPTRSHPVFQKVMLVVVTAGLIWMLVSLTTGGDPGLALAMGASVCAIFAVAAVVWGISGLLKRKKASAGANRAVTFTLTVVLSLVVLAAMTFLIIGLVHTDRDQAPRQTQLPLTLPELLDEDAAGGNWDWIVNLTQSPLLGRLDTHQYLHPQEKGMGPCSLGLSYTLVEVKAPFLYSLCKDTLLHARDRWNDGLPEGERYLYEPIDPAPWGAAEAYRWISNGYGESTALNCFLLCYADRIVQIEFDWEPTQGQMGMAGEKLGG